MAAYSKPDALIRPDAELDDANLQRTKAALEATLNRKISVRIYTVSMICWFSFTSTYYVHAV